MPDTGAPYFIPYVEATDLVVDYPAANEAMALAIVAALEDIPVKEKRVTRFTGNGTFTPPAGVTYAIAHIRGGGGGVGAGDTGADGGNSSVAFASGTVTATGGRKQVAFTVNMAAAQSGQPNSGNGGQVLGVAGGSTGGDISGANSSGTFIVAGAAVTPGVGVSVVVGAGGTAGTSGAAGGSGYVYIEFEQEV